MDWEDERAARNDKPANDNAVPADGGRTASSPSAETVSSAEKLDRLVCGIARLIGRQIAREDYKRRTAANNNREPEGGSDED